MAELNLDLREIRALPNEVLDGLHRNIRARCDRMESRTAVFVLAFIFSKLAGPPEFREIMSKSDSMGGIDITLRLAAGAHSLDMEYSQSITESWQSVNVDRFEHSASLPAGAQFSWDLHLVGSGFMNINIAGISDEAANSITGMLPSCFASVMQHGERERRYVAGLSAAQKPEPARAEATPAPKTPLEALVAVFDEERNPYMEWHDGPSLSEVDSAMSRLLPGEKAEASRIVAERIKKSYDPYLGRAAELLGTEECRAALDAALAGALHPATASNVARNLLTLGSSAEAVNALRAIVSNPGLHWSDRIDALVNLKIALDAAGDRRPVSGFITPELEESIFEAVCDDDYLVRYHAAEALLKAAGIRKELSEHKELFGFICGKAGDDKPPEEAERAGFRKAVEIIRKMIGK
jgi:hypothetical protein